MRLDSNGVWLTIQVDSQPSRACDPGAGAIGPAISQAPISLDTESTVKYMGPNGVLVQVSHGGWCYAISFVTNYVQARDQHMNEISQILSSFRFNR
jgi:hypothetical protein